jgi:hypothetical protein
MARPRTRLSAQTDDSRMRDGPEAESDSGAFSAANLLESDPLGGRPHINRRPVQVP